MVLSNVIGFPDTRDEPFENLGVECTIWPEAGTHVHAEWPSQADRFPDIPGRQTTRKPDRNRAIPNDSCGKRPVVDPAGTTELATGNRAGIAAVEEEHVGTRHSLRKSAPGLFALDVNDLNDGEIGKFGLHLFPDFRRYMIDELQ